MSLNKLINAVIALVEDRPADAREMLRSPEMKVPTGEVQKRLSTSILRRERGAKIEALKKVLSTALLIDADIVLMTGNELTEREKQAYYLGVSEVERIVENAIETIGDEILS